MVKEKKIDARFQRILQDPRFKKIPKNERKVKIDSRFSKMFSDDRFHTKVSVDKRGRPIQENAKENLEKFYELEDESDKEDVEKEQTKGDEEDLVKKDKRDKGKRKKEKLKIDLENQGLDDDTEEEESSAPIDFTDIRGESLENDNYSDSSSDEKEETFEEADEDIIHGWGELDSEAKRIENAETHRLAVCNCDWDRVTANDLFMLFTSFKPTGGIIKSVKIYLSDFGEERLKEEEISGPQELKEIVRESDEEESDTQETTEGSKYHMEKLREYQLKRLKYYYAVVECCDKATADKIYEECDGMEYEMSGTRLDLRFVPEDMTFDREPKSVSTELPNVKNYQPATFLNTALQQSTVRLTWDETDPKRIESTMRNFTKEDLENMDFKDYIASSSEDESDVKNKKSRKSNDTQHEQDENESESDEEEQRIKKYRLLMEEINSKEQRDVDENDGMEVTWSMENKASNLNNDDDDDDDIKVPEESEDEFTDGGDGESDSGAEEVMEDDEDMVENKDGDEGFNDPFFTEPSGEHIESDDDAKENSSTKKKDKKKKKKGRKAEEMTEKERKKKKELELLLIDGDDEKKHFSLKGILEQEKMKKKTRKKRKLKKEVAEDGFVFDTKDDRFNALYESHLYSIDPSEPNFKKTKATEAIIKEAQKRREERANQRQSKVNYDGTKGEKPLKEDASKAKLSALVKSVKSKTMNHQIQRKKRKLK